MPEEKTVKITPAKGRPMLTWVGKRPLSRVTAFPAQHIETFSPLPQRGRGACPERSRRDGGEGWADWPQQYPRGGLLFHGDNKEILAHLLANGLRGKVKLIYIDPPFNTGADNYVRRVRLRRLGAPPLNGEDMTWIEQAQYANSFFPDLYLQFMYERLTLLREVMDQDGAILLRIDYRYAHYLKVLMDEVFGNEYCLNEILVSRRRESAGSPTKLEVATESLFVYRMSDDCTFHKPRIPRPVANIQWTSFLMGGERQPRERTFLGVTLVPPRDQHFPLSQEKVEKLVAERFIRLRCRGCGTLHYYGPSQESLERYMRRAANRFKFHDLHAGRLYYGAERIGGCLQCSGHEFAVEYLGSDVQAVTNVWTDIPSYSQTTDYPTENSEDLLERLIITFSNHADLVLDCFIGSGTTAAVAQKLGRRWIGCDINKGAIQTTSKRLQTIIQEQVAAQSNNRQKKLVEAEDAPPEPAQLSFTVWRVNDYDLQIQHNEAVNLACEHMGIERTRSDPFFDGALGRNLVKIIPFNHPLSPLDLEEIRRELDARPEEDRNITLVCLGKELTADTWIEDWNRLRKGENAVNRIETIELRTDPRYGKFIEHKPAAAKVNMTREENQIRVEIQDFISPTIIERLQQQAGVLQPHIDDWRAMVDCVMIDPAYDGEVFKVALSDVPEKKDDLVEGTYTLPAPEGPTTVAVKITDMLGEEVLFTELV